MSNKTGPSSSELRKFQATVLEYYRTQGRHALPWRKTKNPYKILISEVMLQQTQVERVVPYFTLFLQRFPTLHALADSPLGLVLTSCQGLGYNRRAKMLWQCAREIVAHHQGNMPKERDALESLSGIGPYTAGAIRAFAHNEPEVFIETNIRSALLFHFFPHGRAVDDRRLIPILESLVLTAESPREWYSALMDYGTYIKRTYPNPSRKSKHHMKQKPFAGSLREMRGAILRALVQKDSLQNLRARGGVRFVHALHDLEKEGMIERRGEVWTLVR